MGAAQEIRDESYLVQKSHIFFQPTDRDVEGSCPPDPHLNFKYPPWLLLLCCFSCFSFAFGSQFLQYGIYAMYFKFPAWIQVTPVASSANLPCSAGCLEMYRDQRASRSAHACA